MEEWQYTLVRERIPPRLYAIEHEMDAIEKTLFGVLTQEMPQVKSLGLLWRERVKLKKHLVREVRKDYPIFRRPGIMIDCVLEEYLYTEVRPPS